MEVDAAKLSDRLDEQSVRLCSAMSAWEALAGLRQSYQIPQDVAKERVRALLRHFYVEYVTIGETEYDIAVDAYGRFGKGRHPAALNFGDCFAYACAKANKAALLFKGHDFSKTGIEIC